MPHLLPNLAVDALLVRKWHHVVISINWLIGVGIQFIQNKSDQGDLEPVCRHVLRCIQIESRCILLSSLRQLTHIPVRPIDQWLQLRLVKKSIVFGRDNLTEPYYFLLTLLLNPRPFPHFIRSSSSGMVQQMVEREGKYSKPGTSSFGSNATLSKPSVIRRSSSSELVHLCTGLLFLASRLGYLLFTLLLPLDALLRLGDRLVGDTLLGRLAICT